jgi:hypothetical protein
MSRTELPPLKSSVEFQEFIEHKIQNIKTAIQRIKSSGEKRPQSSRVSQHSSETPLMSI